MNAPIKLTALSSGAILPSPAWRRSLLASASQQQVTLDELAEQIRCDPALTGKVIGMANAAPRAGGRAFAAVNADALTAIGLPALQHAFAEPDPPGALCADFDEQRYRSHSLAMACAARVAGDALQLAPADELFSCGLLANTGQLALATLHAEDYGQILQQHGDRPLALQLCEQSRRFNYHQLSLSAILMRSWGMPELLCSAVCCHAVPPGWGRAGSMMELAWLLKLASAFADLILMNGAGSRKPGLAAARVLGLDAERTETLLRHSNADWSEWRDMLAPPACAAPIRPRARQRRRMDVAFSEFI